MVKSESIFKHIGGCWFIPNPENEVNHKDGNKRTVNHFNLEWNTPKVYAWKTD
jgi:hypothetical protein